MDVPIKNYSSGMHMRLGFAIAANLDPDVLLLDEIFAVGDEDFQRQCMATLRVVPGAGKTIVFVSHSSAAVQAICQRACVLDHGRLLFDGPVDRRPDRVPRVDAARAARSARARARARDRSHGGHAFALERGEPQDPRLAWHRLATGGRWDEEGAWVFDFLRRQGLRPDDHFVLDMGCGSLSARPPAPAYMQPEPLLGIREEHRAVHRRRRRSSCRAPACSAERGHFLVNDDFDLQRLAVSVRSGDRQLAVPAAAAEQRRARASRPWSGSSSRAAGSIATWTPNPDPANFAPIVHADGTTTYSDREPYHYRFEMLASLAAVVGAQGRTPRRSIAPARRIGHGDHATIEAGRGFQHGAPGLHSWPTEVTVWR